MSRKRKSRHTRRDVENRKTERQIDEATAQNKREHSVQAMPNASAPIGNTPKPTSQTEAPNSSNPAKGSSKIMRLFKAFPSPFAFTDRHNGSITAIGTIAIAVLTFYYVTYSKAQWEVMTETNKVTAEALRVSQRAHVTLGRKDGVVAELVIPQDPK